MVSFKRLAEEFKSIFLLLSRRNALILTIITLFLILGHYLYFKTAHWNSPMDGNPTFWYLLVGIIAAIDVFGKLRGHISGTHYLLTPSNTFEKFFAAWLYTTILAFVAAYLTYNLTHVVCMLVGNAFTSQSLPIEIQGIREIGSIFVNVIFFQSIYFLGSAFFKKNPFIKTTGLMLISIMVLGLLMSWIVSSYMNTSFNFENGGNHSFNFENGRDWENLFNTGTLPQLLENLKIISKIFYYGTPFIAWSLTYLTLKNKQL